MSTAPVDLRACTCYPCTAPGWGAPGIAHCAACCSGTGIVEYDHECPVAEHRKWAAIQVPVCGAHACGRCEGAGFLILDRVARATGELIDVECPRCRGTGTVR